MYSWGALPTMAKLTARSGTSVQERASDAKVSAEGGRADGVPDELPRRGGGAEQGAVADGTPPPEHFISGSEGSEAYESEACTLSQPPSEAATSHQDESDELSYGEDFGEYSDSELE